MFKRHGPGCPCCHCVIDALPEETAFTTDVIRTAVHPQSPYPAWLQAEVKAAVGDTLKLFLAWDEDTPGDGLYIEYTPADGATAGTLKLFRKDATQLGATLDLLCADAAYWHRLTLCYDPDTQEFTACFDARDARDYVVRGQCVSATVPVGFAAGTKAGYGGTGSIRNYKYDRLWYCGDPPYTSDCHVLGDDWDYSNELPPRTNCHKCGAGCTVVSETFAGIAGDINTPGDMPCDWDAGATNWGVVNEMATGDGPVCHKFDTTSGSYYVSATFYTGNLATRGDLVTVSLSYGTTTHSLTITRVASSPPGGADRYLYAWLPVGFGSFYLTAAQHSIISEIELKICLRSLCHDDGNDVLHNILFDGVVLKATTAGTVCVSITQPTLAGHTNASLTGLQIIKSVEMDEDCPPCCPAECDLCIVPETLPESIVVELAGITGEPWCTNCANWNGAYYAVSNGSCSYASGTYILTCTPGSLSGQMAIAAQLERSDGTYPSGDVGDIWLVVTVTFYVPDMPIKSSVYRYGTNLGPDLLDCNSLPADMSLTFINETTINARACEPPTSVNATLT